MPSYFVEKGLLCDVSERLTAFIGVSFGDSDDIFSEDIKM